MTKKNTSTHQLANPKLQDLFIQTAPNALAPDYIYSKNKNNKNCDYNIVVQETEHYTGLKKDNEFVSTPIYGYGLKDDDYQVTWPGKTFEVKSNEKIIVNWVNELYDDNKKPLTHFLPIDESLTWCYSLHDKQRTLDKDGIPLVTHLHGGHNSQEADGNPEYFKGLTKNSEGPRFISEKYEYDNSQRAGTLWYHDHALGITRLNVYAGLAGFYIIRDEYDTGKHSNPLGLPAKQYELAYCVQDRQFYEDGCLHFPADNLDKEWEGFIVEQKANPPYPEGPSILAEFFGDHILVNGKLWPKANVEPRHYRIRLLNGCDSRFMCIQLRRVPAGATDFTIASEPLEFTVVGSDQGLLKKSTRVTSLNFIPGERLDIVFDFSEHRNSRIIIENILGDDPFNGEVPNPADLDPQRRTNRIMAFDVNLELNSESGGHLEENEEKEYSKIEDRFDKMAFDNSVNGLYPDIPNDIARYRKLALFEGEDQYNRLMPMLGTAELVTDISGTQVSGSMIWKAAITENPAVGDTEIWDIYNATPDAHPIHVHMVHFDIISRRTFKADTVKQAVITDSGDVVNGSRLENISDQVATPPFPVLDSEKGPKDMVLCYPNEITRIKMTFDRAGRYIWHCHILSHEDSEMMRPFHVGPA